MSLQQILMVTGGGVAPVTPISLVAHTAATGSTYAAITSAIDTTGSSLLVVSLAWDTNEPTLSDSKGNTWTGLTTHTGSTNSTRLFYCANPTVGAGHTFLGDAGVLTSFVGIAVAGFDNTHATPFDQQNGNAVTSGTDVPTGSVTPSENNGLIVTGLQMDIPGGTATIDSAFIVTDSSTGPGGYSSAIAYLVQTTASAVNPTWTSPIAGRNAAGIATFKHS